MSTTLAASAFLMGLAGGPHCAAMCGAACGGLVRFGAGRDGNLARPMLVFQFGRLAGYAAAGAAAAFAVDSFAWLSTQTATLRPALTMFHLAVLAWGLMLLVYARQPAWVSGAGRSVWSRVRPLASTRGGMFATGALWIFMPCGLLYSALLVASLSGGPAYGALSMALFAAGSAISLVMAPALLQRLQAGGSRARQEWGTRAAGVLLVLAAAWALWSDTMHRIAQWCGLA